MRTKPGRILVINPNSNQKVTDGLDEALQPFRQPEGAEIDCVTLADGPFGIESQEDIEAVVLPLRELVVTRTDVDCFVIACYSDPGLQVCREASERPVLGIQECGILTAMARGDRFGVIALAPKSIQRHLRYMRQMGVSGRLAAERSADLSVAESASGSNTLEKLVDVGTQLRDEDGADTIVLGCAGMAVHRGALEERLNVPVIDPVQSAVAMALGAVATRA